MQRSPISCPVLLFKLIIGKGIFYYYMAGLVEIEKELGRTDINILYGIV